MAYRIVEERNELGPDEFVEFRVHEVPRSAFFSEGIKYSMSYVRKGNCILRYDNERGKGHHKHFNGEESDTEFAEINTHMKKFLQEVAEIRRDFDETKGSHNYGQQP